MSKNASIDYFFGTTDYEGKALRHYCLDQLGIGVMVAPLDSSENYYSIEGSFSSVSSNLLRMTAFLPYVRMEQGKTMVVIQVNDYTYQSEMCSGIVEQAPLNGLNVLAYYQDMPFDWTDLGAIEGYPNRSTIWSGVLEEVIALNPDTVVVCDYSYGAEFALNYMRQKNWMPKLMVIAPIYAPFQDPTLLDYVITITPYSAAAKYPAQANFVDSGGYNALALARYGIQADEFMAEATLAGMMWSNAIVNAESNQTSDLVQAMRLSQIQSFMGLTAMDVRDRQTIPCLVVQFLSASNVSNVVGPPNAATDPIIYPMPTWSERVFAPQWGSPVEIASAVLTIVGLLVAFGWMVFLITHRKHPAVVTASPAFCFSTLVGSICVFASIITWMPNLITTAQCNSRSWVLPIGFMLMFGSLLAKTERIVRIYYQSQTMKTIRVSNFQVFTIISVLVGIQIILSIFMVSATQSEANVYMVDPYRLTLNYWQCSFPRTLKILFGISAGYAGCLLIWGTWLAWHVRNVPISAYDESKVIIFSIYNTAFFAIIAIAIQLGVGGTNRDLTFMITALCCFLGAIITISALFVPKWLVIYYPSALESSTSGDSSTGRTMSVYHQPAHLVQPPRTISSNTMSTAVEASAETYEKVLVDKRIAALQVKLDNSKKKVKVLKAKLKRYEAGEGATVAQVVQ